MHASVRLMQGHLHEALDQHEAKVQELLNTELDTRFAEVSGHVNYIHASNTAMRVSNTAISHS